jgi:phage terminase large subunit
MNANGDINIFVHPRCSGTIASLERTKWVDNNPNTATIDKKEGIEHFSDGIRYAQEYLMPVRSAKKGTARGFSF